MGKINLTKKKVNEINKNKNNYNNYNDDSGNADIYYLNNSKNNSKNNHSNNNHNYDNNKNNHFNCNSYQTMSHGNALENENSTSTSTSTSTLTFQTSSSLLNTKKGKSEINQTILFGLHLRELLEDTHCTVTSVFM